MSNICSTGSNLFSGLIKKKNGGNGKSKKAKSDTAQNSNKKNNEKFKNESESENIKITKYNRQYNSINNTNDTNDTDNTDNTDNTNNKINTNTTNRKKNNKENDLNDLKNLKKSLFCDDDDDSVQIEDTQKTEKEQNENDICGKTYYLNSQWTVWVHRNDCDDWTVDSYKNIHLIDSIGSFWEFFNNFHKINKEENQYFIMRNKIKPIWEDNNNRIGGICSLKMDCYDRNTKKDIGSEFLLCLCVLMMNESFMQDNQEINGISYAIKNRSIYIKIWTKDYGNNIMDKLPKNLIAKFNSVIRNNMFKKFENYISIRYKPIKPEYEEQEK